MLFELASNANQSPLTATNHHRVLINLYFMHLPGQYILCAFLILQEDISKEIIEVPVSMIGHIIGKGGQTVRTLQEDSGTKIDVDKTGKVSIRGSTDAIVNAMDMIGKLMEGLLDWYAIGYARYPV